MAQTDLREIRIGDLKKIRQENPNLIKMGQKRTLYVKIEVCFFVGCKIKSP
jgi:hypothetical protein